jgi:hypothetical protein
MINCFLDKCILIVSSVTRHWNVDAHDTRFFITSLKEAPHCDKTDARRLWRP